MTDAEVEDAKERLWDAAWERRGQGAAGILEGLTETLRRLLAEAENRGIERAAKVAHDERDGFICSYHDANEDGLQSCAWNDACDAIEAAIRRLKAPADGPTP